jgi:hypothetical protein
MSMASLLVVVGRVATGQTLPITDPDVEAGASLRTKRQRDCSNSPVALSLVPLPGDAALAMG